MVKMCVYKKNLLNDNTDYKKALRACNEGMLKLNKLEDLELFCYTQDCFFGSNTWNELTKTHRGALYVNGQRVNKAFDKIFNVGEVDECSLDTVQHRMETEEYSVFHKANGHLFIVSIFEQEGSEFPRICCHTKGGLAHQGNDLLNDDIQIFYSMYGEKILELADKFPNSTWMFEAIVSHDKHTLYDQDVERYGSENTFVLLGANIHSKAVGEWVEVPYEAMRLLSESFIGCSVVENMDQVKDLNIEEWYKHTDTEGYVIKFHSDNYRVKVKTKEYWALRFKKDLTTERILEMVKSKGDSKLITKLPEEVAEPILDVLSDSFMDWYIDIVVDRSTLDDWFNKDKKEIGLSDELSKEQKSYIFSVMKGEVPSFDKLITTKSLRTLYVQYILSSKNELGELDRSIKKIVDMI